MLLECERISITADSQSDLISWLTIRLFKNLLLFDVALIRYLWLRWNGVKVCGLFRPEEQASRIVTLPIHSSCA